MVSPRGTECAPAAAAGERSRGPRSDVRRILIVGAGGFGREVLQWARDAWPDAAERIAGFLSEDPGRLDGRTHGVGIIGSPDAFVLEPDDACLLAIGIPGVRRRVAEGLACRGARFLSLVHPSAVVATTAAIGAGAIVCPYAVVSDGARVGACVIVNYHASLGHDASVGDFAVLSPYATLGGGADVAEDVFLGLHASVGPLTRIGRRSKVSANSCALTDVPSDCLVHGVPGRVGPLLG